MIKLQRYISYNRKIGCVLVTAASRTSLRVDHLILLFIGLTFSFKNVFYFI